MGRLLTTEEVANHYGLSSSTILRRIRSGVISTALNVGTESRPIYRIPEESIGDIVRNAPRTMPEGIEKII